MTVVRPFPGWVIAATPACPMKPQDEALSISTPLLRALVLRVAGKQALFMEWNVSETLTCDAGLDPSPREPQFFELFAFCYEDRFQLLPQLTAVFVQCGGWVLERRTLSATAVEFRFEIQMAGILDLYADFLALGVELTRDAHATLADLCTCHRHARFSATPHQVLTFRLEVSFLADATLHSILMTSHGSA
jgi:hypothetical protein